MQKVKVFLIRFLVVLLALQGAVAAQLLNIKSAQAADPARTVVINEIMWMGSVIGGVNKTADEWIELRNTTNAAIDLSGWLLTNSATSGGTLTIPEGKSIPANSFFLIGNYNETSADSILNVAPDWETTSVALSNTCSQIDLKSNGETIVDSMGCNTGDYFFPASSATKHSLERNIVIADGLLATSLHESIGFANLDASATPENLATPKVANDITAPTSTSAIVNDGASVDIDWSANTAQISVNWSGWADLESGITDYVVGLGTTPLVADFSPLASVGNVLTKTIPFLATTTTGTFYTIVKPVNGVGIAGAIKASDGFTIDVLNPTTPANLAVTDVPLDNGGSLKATWSASTSLDQITYQLNYRKVGDSVWTSVIVGTALEKTISGLLNSPTTYEFTVQAIDFNIQHSVASGVVTAKALDNLVPIIDVNKIVISQNKPGSADTVSGVSGASNEAPVTVTLLSAVPGDPTAVIIGSVLSNADGSFPAIGIGDNKYAQVWLQLTDASSNLSLPLQLNNDIVGPTAPILNKAVAKCESDTCRVNLEWLAGSTDTASYKVIYTVDGVDNQTFEVTATSMAMDLTTGKSYLFKVLGYDAFGNPSTSSNVFSITLTKGVKTTVVLTNGQPVTTTEAISGTIEVKTTPVARKTAPAQFAPKVKAAEPVTESPTAPTPPLVADTENSRDWVRILVVVVLLIIIAGSFYALSRSVRETPEEEFDRKKADSKDGAETGTTKHRRRRRNRRK